MTSTETLLRVDDVKVYFKYGGTGLAKKKEQKYIKAVDGISFDIKRGETLGIVGESGCGKSTLARAVIRMVPSHSGRVLWMGQDLLELDGNTMRDQRKDLQMIFQDPLASLNPRMTLGQIIAEPLKTHFPKMPRSEIRAKVAAMMARVGLLPNMVNRYPHEFSGGQCQRIGIARALILEPKLIICDEPVSALDVSIQAQVINLLMDLQKELNLSLMFIAHDLSVVKHISTRVMVLYLGNVVELAESEAIYRNPSHPYTRALIAAVPDLDKPAPADRASLMVDGELPSPLAPPSGCPFRTRCPMAQDICSTDKPKLETSFDGHSVACHFHRVDQHDN
ncbi:ABC transporter ATP-binding protein [uncultured Ruegeria sp.]|uniref:ABC transporter ATP-binding protein n=1 Tax=uncultured Ruegeria sp. TaxID=259304 RepID=UPI00260B502C|nr:dipeptide ABC transporter ATP-binding protein [uncultured Ruegeria sp.]